MIILLTDPTIDSNFKSVRHETLISPARESNTTPAGPNMSSILVTDSILENNFFLILGREKRISSYNYH